MRNAIGLLTIFTSTFLISFVCNDNTDNPNNIQPSRVLFTDVKISQDLIDLNQTLLMRCKSHKKNLTENQAKWIEKFLVSLKNWINILRAVQRMPKYVNKTKAREQKEFNAWITGGYNNYFQMTYEFSSYPDKEQIWNVVIYTIFFDGLYMAEVKLIKAETDFEISEEKFHVPNTNVVDYRKDRVYRIGLIINVPKSCVKIEHEIVQHGEQPQYQYLLKESERTVNAKPGILRFVLHNIKIHITATLTEIDKRFVVPHPKDGTTYYFQMPIIEDLQITVGEIQPCTTTYQVKEGYSNANTKIDNVNEKEALYLKEILIGDNLNVAKADQILVDFMSLLKSDNKHKLADYVEAALVNKFSKAVMTSPDIATLLGQLEHESYLYDASFPCKIDQNMIIAKRQFLFMSYSYHSLFKTILDMIEVQLKNQDSKKLTAREALYRKVIAAGPGVDEISNDDGFDVKEDRRLSHYNTNRQNQPQQSPSLNVNDAEKPEKNKIDDGISGNNGLSEPQPEKKVSLKNCGHLNEFHEYLSFYGEFFFLYTPFKCILKMK